MRNEDGHENSCDHEGRPVRKRKQEHTERRYRIEGERPIPVNRFCSFIAVRESTDSDALSEWVTQALNGNHGVRENWRRSMSLGIRFRFDGK